MQLNQGFFMQNGRCGYVLRPDCMNSPSYNPDDAETLTGVDALLLTVTVNI
jgi:hypothetical protein